MSHVIHERRQVEGQAIERIVEVPGYGGFRLRCLHPCLLPPPEVGFFAVVVFMIPAAFAVSVANMLVVPVYMPSLRQSVGRDLRVCIANQLPILKGIATVMVVALV